MTLARRHGAPRFLTFLDSLAFDSTVHERLARLQDRGKTAPLAVARAVSQAFLPSSGGFASIPRSRCHPHGRVRASTHFVVYRKCTASSEVTGPRGRRAFARGQSRASHDGQFAECTLLRSGTRRQTLDSLSSFHSAGRLGGVLNLRDEDW
ncbi:hypothetical protein OH77DRAFT_1247669 [Trametes cingulata]|nr:hypothetical protein OH77DRAFT_1247669 [Trametes cingulata]